MFQFFKLFINHPSDLHCNAVNAHFSRMNKWCIPFFVLLSQLLWSQPDDFRYDNFVYMPHIKSVQFNHLGLPTSDPILDLNSAGQLILTFDDVLGGDITYNYKLIHCNKDWNRTDMDELEYVDGFNDEDIDTWAYSNTTVSDYTRYELLIPNDNIDPIISGNYLLLVYEDDTDLPVLTRRLMVVENLVTINPLVRRSISALQLKSHHQLEFTINNENFSIQNPQRDVYVSILQNGRWDNAITNRQPVFNRGADISFNSADYFLFPASREFRFADVRSLQYPGSGVHSVDRHPDRIDVLLQLDGSRNDRSTFDYRDINGKFVIENADDSNDFLTSEYVDVHFTLRDLNPDISKDVYVIGGFSDWNCLGENKLTYSSKHESYIGNILLKQGFYDYQYATRDQDGTVDYEHYEGNSFETINDYTFLVYYRPFGARYDRIIGATVETSAF